MSELTHWDAGLAAARAADILVTIKRRVGGRQLQLIASLLFDGKAVKSRLMLEYGNEQKVARQWASKWNDALRRARLPELAVIVRDEPTGVHLDVAGRRIDF